ncbi:MAG: hypothetical protein QW374_04910 [Candidatus Bathyarchaeia archaeon]|nr:hypothetical protein [Candidatus Bathyarchaeota archaeon]
MKRILNTIIEFRHGVIFHILFGFIGAVLGYPWLFSLIFIFKQILDLIDGDPPARISGEVAEYTLGLILGLLVDAFII